MGGVGESTTSARQPAPLFLTEPLSLTLHSPPRRDWSPEHQGWARPLQGYVASLRTQVQVAVALMGWQIHVRPVRAAARILSHHGRPYLRPRTTTYRQAPPPRPRRHPPTPRGVLEEPDNESSSNDVIKQAGHWASLFRGRGWQAAPGATAGLVAWRGAPAGIVSPRPAPTHLLSTGTRPPWCRTEAS